LQKLYQTLNEWKTHRYMSVLKLPLLVDLQQKVGELVLSITCPTVIILENTLNQYIEKCGYCNSDNRRTIKFFLFNLGMGNFTKVVRVCANSLWIGPRLPKVIHMLLSYTGWFNGTCWPVTTSIWSGKWFKTPCHKWPQRAQGLLNHFPLLILTVLAETVESPCTTIM
jgi:hypothetical protein